MTGSSTPHRPPFIGSRAAGVLITALVAVFGAGLAAVFAAVFAVAPVPWPPSGPQIALGLAGLVAAAAGLGGIAWAAVRDAARHRACGSLPDDLVVVRGLFRLPEPVGRRVRRGDPVPPEWLGPGRHWLHQRIHLFRTVTAGALFGGGLQVSVGALLLGGTALPLVIAVVTLVVAGLTSVPGLALSRARQRLHAAPPSLRDR